MGARTWTSSPIFQGPSSTRETVAATPDWSSVAANFTVAVSLRHREPMPLAVVTGGVVSPGAGVTVGTTVGSAAGGAWGGIDSGGDAGAAVTCAATLMVPGMASPMATMKTSR